MTKLISRFWQINTFLAPLITESYFWNAVCVCACMHTCLIVPVLFNRFYSYWVFKSLFIIGPSMNILALKTRALHMASKT
jgi:hypothetical protein